MSDPNERIPLHLVGGLKPRRSKFDSLLQLLPADDRSRSILDNISRDFIHVLTPSARAYRIKDGSYLHKSGFIVLCQAIYGDVVLVDRNGTESSHHAGVYWWDCGPPSKRVILRGSLTATLSRQGIDGGTTS